MRKLFGIILSILLIAVCAAALADVKVDSKNFPDKVFLEYIKKNVDKDKNLVLDHEEIANTTKINLSNQTKITSLEGIQYFTKLKELNIKDVKIESLDISKNTELVGLQCEHTYNLTSLKLSKNTKLESLMCRNSGITSLDLSNNTHLKSLNCEGIKITSLDLSHNIELKYAVCSYCGLTSLTLGNNSKLTDLECQGNELKDLNLQNCSALFTLNCSESHLSSLNVANCSKLTNLYCYTNNLSSLDVSGLQSLSLLNCNHNQLKELNVKGCKALGHLSCDQNILTTLDLRENEKLGWIDCSYNKLESLKITGLSELNHVDCFHNQLAFLDISGCTLLNQIVAEGNNYESVDECSFVLPNVGEIDYDKITGIQTDSGLIPAAYEAVQIESVSVNKGTITITRTSWNKEPGFGIGYDLYPEGSKDDLEWSSSNEEVATVDAHGYVTFHKAGKVTIRCQSKGNPNAKASKKFKVKDTKVESITLKKSKITLKKKKSYQLEIKKIKPSQAVNQKVKWKTSDKHVATVDKNGKVKAVGKGECIITCEAKDGSGAKAEVTVKVK